MKFFFYLFTALFLFTHTNSDAQVQKGNIIIGGLINPSFYSRDHTSDDMQYNVWQINSQIRFGYFLANKFSMGIDLENNNSISKSENQRSTNSSIMAGPFMRYYFINQKLGLFGEGGAGLGIASSRYKSTSSVWGPHSDKWTDNRAYIKVGPGINYFLKENIAIELLMTYQRHWSTWESSNSSYQNKDKSKIHVLDLKVGLIFLF